MGYAGIGASPYQSWQFAGTNAKSASEVSQNNSLHFHQNNNTCGSPIVLKNAAAFIVTIIDKFVLLRENDKHKCKHKCKYICLHLCFFKLVFR